MNAIPTHETEPLLDVIGVSKRFGDVHAVSDLSFALDGGAVLIVTGPTGSGKSTALALMAAVLRPSSGTVHVAGIDTVDRPRVARRHIGYLGDIPIGTPHITVREALRFAARCHRVDPDRRDGVVEGLVELFDLGSVADRTSASLTTGQQRRVAMARMLVHDPALILLDEPLDGLDDAGRGDVTDIIAGLAGAGKAVIAATTRVDELLDVATAIATLDDGRLADVHVVDPLLIDPRSIDPRPIDLDAVDERHAPSETSTDETT